MPDVSPSAPNLLLIGAPRCASTAFAVALGEHPDVYVSEPKEPHFLATHGVEASIDGIGRETFDADRLYDHERWLALFRQRRERYRLDASVTTITYPEVSIPNIQRYCGPDTRLLVLLRNPVERAFSSYMYCVSRGWDAGSFEECLAAEPARIEAHWQHLWFLQHLSQYEARLRPFFEAFPRQHIKLVITEEFSADPASVLDEVFTFLDLPRQAVDGALRLNAGGQPNSPVVGRALAYVRGHPRLLQMAKRVSTPRFRETLKQRNLTRVQMADDTRRRLDDRFAHTREWVCREMQRALPGWE